VNVQADWNTTDANLDSYIRNKPTLAPSDAEANVQSDWNVTDQNSDAYIANKPTVPTNNNQLENGAGYITSGDLPTMAPSNAEANVQVNWDETDAASDAYILNKPTDHVSGTATSGSTAITEIKTLTQAEYTALSTYSSSIMYVIVG
jgi:hypothetical protein